MEKQILKEQELKKIIKLGYNLKLISVEFKVPMVILEEYEKKIKNEENATIEENKKEENAAKKEIRKPMLENPQILVMREKYYKIYNKQEYNINTIKETKRQLADTEIQMLEKEYEKIKVYVSKVEDQTLETKEKKKYLVNILNSLKKYNDIFPYFDKTEEIYNLIESSKLNYLSSFKTYSSCGSKTFDMEWIKSKINKVYMEFISNTVNDMTDIEELKKILKRIDKKRALKYPLTTGKFYKEIEDKIHKIEEKNARERFRNDISTEIKNLASNIAEGNVDIKKANETIDSEANIKYEKSPKTKFSLTLEQQRKQVIMQIRTLLSENGKQYVIKDIKRTFQILQELCGTEIQHNFSVISNNFISGKRFEDARKLCSQVSGIEQLKMVSKIQKAQIIKAEIGDLVLKAIDKELSGEEQQKFIQTLESEIKNKKIIPSEINLGYNCDNTRKITLEDLVKGTELLRD